jgi:purine-nucleoside phosphorylase
MTGMNDLLAIDTIRQCAPALFPTVAVVLGSGWGELTRHLEQAVRIPYADLQGFPNASIAGHSGELWLGLLGAQSVAIMSGRKHAYESGAVDGMNTPIRVLHALGCHTLVQTNAAGSLRANMPAQSLMVLSDHINFPQRSPLIGAPGSERFVGMVDAYDLTLRLHAHAVAKESGVSLHEGVYAWAFGPQFETPAEVRMLAQWGADAVGMSTVLETIVARHAGMRVLALSIVTNLGAGLSDESLSHAHTLAQAKLGSGPASALLAQIIATLPAPP